MDKEIKDFPFNWLVTLVFVIVGYNYDEWKGAIIAWMMAMVVCFFLSVVYNECR